MDELALMDRDEVLALDREIKIRKARESLQDFIEYIMFDPDHHDDVSFSKFDCCPHHKIIIEMFEGVEKGISLRSALSIAPQHGKQLADSTPVFTPNGWKKHGDLKVGDKVFGLTGNPVKVIAISEKTQATLRLTTAHGEKIKAHARHEWVVFDNQQNKIRTLETQDLINYGVKMKGGRLRFSFPLAGVISLPEKKLPMPPYVLGAWLGDGRALGACISHAKKDFQVVEKIKKLGYKISSQCVHKKTGVVSTYFVNGFHTLLKTMNIHDNKHIPEEYLTASAEQRLELLAGLIDTDGCVQKKYRRICFSNTNLLLIRQVACLIRSFGWRATIAKFSPRVSSSGIVGKKTVYQLTFSPDIFIPTVIPRKKISPWKVMRRRDSIKSITSCKTELGNCIQVDAQDGIYLVGERMIPTHNSTCTTLYGAAWSLARTPTMNIIVGTYSEPRAEMVGDQVRQILQSDRFRHVFPGFRLRKGATGKGYLGTEEGGGIIFAGRGSAVTGNPCDLFLIDDPIKDHQEANSPTVRQQCWDWYCAVVFSRLHTLSRIFIIHTRWVEDDLIGRQCDPSHSSYDAASAEKWSYVNLPAIVEDQELADTLGIEVGHPLWERKFSLELLMEAKKQNPETFSALYMGKPVPDEGGFFKKEMIVEYDEADRPEKLKLYAVSDHALSKKAKGDSTVLLIFGLCQNGVIWLVDCFWGKVDPLECVDAMCSMMEKHAPITWWAGRDHIVGTLGPFLKKRMQERRIFKTFVQEVSEKGDKQQKAQSIRGRMGMGMVRFPKRAPWLAKAKLELLKFDKAGHDDFVDAMSIIGRQLETLYGANPTGTVKSPDGPKIGTFAWVKWASDLEKSARKAAEGRAGW